MDVTAIRPTATTTLPTTATTAAAVGPGLTIVPPTKSPEAESETPPRIQPSKPISFSNGVLKRHAPPQVSYKECLKNHAASLGGHALDGCGEFMPSPTATPSDPTSLKCAACGCHRNFHRRDMDDNQPTSNAAVTHVIEYHPHHRHHPLPPPGSQHATPAGASARGVRSPGSQSQSPPPISSTYYPGSAPHMLLALSSGAGGGNGVPDNHTTPNPSNGPHHPRHQHPQVHHHHQHQPMMMVNSPSSQPPSRKRFRTKFSQDQKEKMYEFAEKVGWKMQKTNEELVNGFCNEIGVERGVFKVWMHNNKNTFGKRSATVSGSANGGGNPTHTSLNDIPIDDNDNEHDHGDLNGNGNNSNSSISINDQSHHHIQHHHHHQHQQYNGKSNESNAPTNGSSSSS